MNINCDQFSWFDASTEVKELLVLATKTWENPEESLKYMEQALAQNEKDTNLDILVAAYRYFYYQNNYDLALKMANKIIAIIKQSEQLPDDWKSMKPTLVSRQEESQIRLLLNTYAAMGMILAKLGDLEQSKRIIKNIQSMNEKYNEYNKYDFGASILWKILNPPLKDEE